MTRRRATGAGQGKIIGRLGLIASAALVLLCLLAQITPSTSAGFSAQIANTANTAGTAPYFTCTGAVMADAASAVFAYRLDEAAGFLASSSVKDFSGQKPHGTYSGSRKVDGSLPKACPRDPGGAYVPDGTKSYVSTPTLQNATNTFTVEIWFKTTSEQGGRLLGFGNRPTSIRRSYDRHIYLTDSGQLVFGVYPGEVKTIISPLRYNDGAWHHAVATLSDAGMNLYVDAQKVASDPGTKTAQNYSGYWRIGYDKTEGWPSQPSTFHFTGALRFAAVYGIALSPEQISAHYNAGR